MPKYFEPVWSIFFLSLCALVVWTWILWIKSLGQKLAYWVFTVTTLGLLLTTATSVLSTFWFVHAAYTGGYDMMSPAELKFIGYGSLTALLGLVAGLIARRQVGYRLAAISSVYFLLWAIDAITQ